MQKLGASIVRLMLLIAVAVLLFDAVVVGLHFLMYGIIVLLGHHLPAHPQALVGVRLPTGRHGLPAWAICWRARCCANRA